MLVGRLVRTLKSMLSTSESVLTRRMNLEPIT